MDKIPSKADLRDELQRQIDAFTCQGGTNPQIYKGVTGRERPQAILNTPLFNEPKVDRTPMTEVIAAIDSRRQTKANSKKIAKNTAKEKIIYDDFGQPVRKVWTNP